MKSYKMSSNGGHLCAVAFDYIANVSAVDELWYNVFPIDITKRKFLYTIVECVVQLCNVYCTM